jgi:hypothetical protein
MPGAIRPSDLHEISSAIEAAKMDKERDWKRAQEKIQRDMKEAFLARDVQAEAMDRINEAVRRAAEQGLHEIQVMTFPSKFCNDHGRSINNMDPDWPASLEGFAKKAFVFFDKELRPHGYKLGAQIINFPEGVPGDVALYLRW